MRVRASIGVLVVVLGGCDTVFDLHYEEPVLPPPPPERWEQVSGGRNHTCGIRLDHTLWCWGRNDQGQLGHQISPADLEEVEPGRVGEQANWVAVASGPYTTCAINSEDALFCWGYSGQGQIGNAMPSPDPQPMHRIDGQWTSVSVGRYHGCAIAATGAMSCWGHNDEGQLGDARAVAGSGVRPVSSTLTWKTVSVGERATYAIASDDTGWVWGQNVHGQLGLGFIPDQHTPQRLGTGTWVKLSAGYNFACGLQPDGRLRCWGQNAAGQIGDGSTGSSPTPAPVGQDEIIDWVDVATGEAHTCARRASGQVSCWGSNARGQLVSDLTRTQRTLPTPITMDGAWTTLALGDAHTCLLDDQAQLWCAGFAGSGALGVADDGSRREPSLVERVWNSVTTGTNTTCGITSASELACWGSGEIGQIGDGTRFDRATPLTIPGSWSGVSTGGNNTCGIRATTEMSCWGSNTGGRLGNGSDVDSLTPTLVSGGRSYAEVAVANGGHVCARATDEKLYCWGRNDHGQVGQSPGSAASTPTELGGAWIKIAGNNAHSCGIRTTGELQCWGYNGHEALGLPTSSIMPVTTSLSTATPQTVMTGHPSPFDEVASGEDHSCARSGTTAWCWGRNHAGQVGDGTTGPGTGVSQLVGEWRAVGTGTHHSCGIRSDGSLWCWGLNDYGQLGDGTLFKRLEPTRVGTDADWATVTGGTAHTCARKMSGELYCWGGNLYGQLGDGRAWRAELVMITK